MPTDDYIRRVDKAIIRYNTKTKTYKSVEAMQKGIAKMQKAGWEVLEKETAKRRSGHSKIKVHYARRK